MMAQCLEQIESAFEKAEKHFGRKIKRVPVTFSNRMTHTAGKAMYKKNRFSGEIRGTEIRLSAKLLASEGSKFIKRTPGHEAAHIITYELFGNVSGHGKEWQSVMSVIGIDPKRYHSYTTPKGRRFQYRDNLGALQELTIIRHNKLQRGKVRWYEWSKTGGRVSKTGFIKEL